MYKFSSYIACFLLLVFMRLMFPDDFLLNLHAHTHTEHKHSTSTEKHKHEIDERHTHCQLENIFNTPFQPEPGFVLTPPLEHISVYTSSISFVWKFTFPNNIQLRGPPVA